MTLHFVFVIIIATIIVVLVVVFAVVIVVFFIIIIVIVAIFINSTHPCTAAVLVNTHTAYSLNHSC